MKLIFLVFLTTFITPLFSQDIIFLQNGEGIQAKVTEVLENKIKYKRYTALDGPTYYLDKAKIFMIKYENGEKDVFGNKERIAIYRDKEPLKKLFIAKQGLIFAKNYFVDKEEITRKEYKNILKDNNPKAYQAFKTGRATLIAGQAILYPSALILSLDLTTRYFSDTPVESNQIIIGAATMTGVGIALLVISEIKTRKSMEIYNTGLKKDTGFYFDVNGNGIGLSYRF